MGVIVLMDMDEWMNEQHQETFHVLLLGENNCFMSYVLCLVY